MGNQLLDAADAQGAFWGMMQDGAGRWFLGELLLLWN